jgi:hypothetical protein
VAVGAERGRGEMETELECPCCGDVGAEADAKGEFYDGQPLVCGCNGHVCVDEDGETWISNGDEPCPVCDEKESA